MAYEAGSEYRRPRACRGGSSGGARGGPGDAGAPAGAHAAVFYVNTAATTPHNPCTDSTPANACKHVMDAVTQARATVGGDLINIAAGTYPEVVTLTNVDDSGDTLAGAGIPSTSHPGTTIGYPNASSEQAELTLGQFVPPLEPNLTVRDLRVAIADAPSAPDGFVALLIRAPTAASATSRSTTRIPTRPRAPRCSRPSGRRRSRTRRCTRPARPTRRFTYRRHRDPSLSATRSSRRRSAASAMPR